MTASAITGTPTLDSPIAGYALEVQNTGTELWLVVSSGGGNDFSDWIATFPGVGVENGFDDDSDGDGNGNGLENFFGTAPDVFSSGLTTGAVDTGAGTFTFTHPQSGTPVDDLSAAAYRWSTDLETFTPDGIAAGSSTVDFVAVPDTPIVGTTTVTATVTGTPLTKLFVDVIVNQVP